jgi:hypothetical protein
VSTKLDFANWFVKIPSVPEWFGTDKVMQWASGKIASVVYDDLFNHYQNGNLDYVKAYVQMHTGKVQTLDGYKNVNVYGPIVTFLSKQLQNQRNEQLAIHNTLDDTPLANQVISGNIARTQADLAYYQKLSQAISS